MNNIQSVWQLELLLHIRTAGSTQSLCGLSAASIAQSLYMNTEVILGGLLHFEKCGLVKAVAPDVYAYSPVNQELEDAVKQTAQTYTSRRVAVVNLIFSKSESAQNSDS